MLIGGAVLAVTYSLHKIVPAMVTVVSPTPSPTPTPTEEPATDVTLYLDAACTTPMPAGYVINFGTFTAESFSPVSTDLWFKGTEIDYSTIAVTDDLAEYDVIPFVGLPDVGLTDHPCLLRLTLPLAIPVGVYSFQVTVTGSGSGG